jgi:hypothetical protein
MLLFDNQYIKRFLIMCQLSPFLELKQMQPQHFLKGISHPRLENQMGVCPSFIKIAGFKTFSLADELCLPLKKSCHFLKTTE